MTTVMICIGNSDNKLTQQTWSDFVANVHATVLLMSSVVHFAGFSNPAAPWQNACWISELHPEVIHNLRVLLLELAKNFDQDSIAVMFGETVLLKP